MVGPGYYRKPRGMSIYERRKVVPKTPVRRRRNEGHYNNRPSLTQAEINAARAREAENRAYVERLEKAHREHLEKLERNAKEALEEEKRKRNALAATAWRNAQKRAAERTNPRSPRNNRSNPKSPSNNRSNKPRSWFSRLFGRKN